MKTIFARDAVEGVVYKSPKGVLCEAIGRKNGEIELAYHHPFYGRQTLFVNEKQVLHPTNEKVLTEVKPEIKTKRVSNLDKFVEVWNASKSPRECAKKLGIHPSYVYTKAGKARKLGLKLKNHGLKKEKKP
jgi:hypothetical protein